MSVGTLNRRRLLQAGSVLAGTAMLGGISRAASTWPARTLSVMVPYAPGGQGDVLARLLGTPLAQALGQPVVVENRPGASGALGVRAFLQSAPDDHRFLLGQTGEIAINGITMDNPGYDTLKDLRAVALVANTPLVLAVPQNSPFKRLADLIEAARQRPGELSYASSGTATPGHLAAAKLAADSGVEMTHVPYKGAGQAITDLIGAQVHCFFASASSVMTHVQGGRLRALAVASLTRLPALGADVPTVAEEVLPGFAFSLWAGYFAARTTTDAVVEQLARHVNTLIAGPALRQRIESLGSTVTPVPPADFDWFVRSEITRYTRMIRAADIRIQ